MLMRIFIVLISSLFISSPSFADEVWYCVTTNFAQVSEDGIKQYADERFIMSVSPEEVRFKGGYMDNSKMSISDWGGKSNWQAKSKFSISEFFNHDLWYASVIRSVQAFHAKCEKF